MVLILMMVFLHVIVLNVLLLLVVEPPVNLWIVLLLLPLLLMVHILIALAESTVLPVHYLAILDILQHLLVLLQPAVMAIGNWLAVAHNFLIVKILMQLGLTDYHALVVPV